MTRLTAGILDELWAPVVAVTAADGRRSDGLIASTALAASLVPESPRVLVCLARANLTHDLALAAGSFAVHLLPAEPIEPSLALFRTLGTRTGHAGDKLASLATSAGVTGAPLLEDALGYVEARVASTLELDELTVVVGDVVAERRLRDGEHLTIELVRRQLPAEWNAEWERRRAAARPVGEAVGARRNGPPVRSYLHLELRPVQAPAPDQGRTGELLDLDPPDSRAHRNTTNEGVNSGQLSACSCRKSSASC